MFETENRDDRKHSLPAYARDGREHDAVPRAGSLLGLVPADDMRDDALERHRAARSRREERLRREAEASLAAAAEIAASSVAPQQASSQIADNPRPNFRAKISAWLSNLKREAGASASERGNVAEEAEQRLSAAQATPLSDKAVDELCDFGEIDDRQWQPLNDPMKVIGGITRSKMLIVLCTVVGALLGIAVALSTPKKYEAATELLIDPHDLKLVVRDLTQTGFSNEATLAIVENQVRVITSGTVLNKVVDQLHLDDDPEFNSQGGGLGVRSLFSSGDGADDPARRRALAVNRLAASLSVERGGKTFVVVIAVKTRDGEKSALIANTMADVFLKTYSELQSDTASRATEELTARLAELRSSVETAERKVETFKAEHDIIDPQGRLITDDELMKLNDQLSVARARTLELNGKAASAKSADVDAVVGGALPEALTSPTMTELRTQYAILKGELDKLAVKLGPRHPQLQAVQAQLAGARDQIAAKLRRIASSVQTELKRSAQLEEELSSRLAQLKVRQGDVSRDMVELGELERVATAKRAVYEAFLLRARETGEQRDINTANMSVISVAYPPPTATGPSRSTIAMAGTMLGLFAGIGIGGLRGACESLRDTARQRRRRCVTARRDVPLATPPSGNGPEDSPTAPGGDRARRLEALQDRGQPRFQTVPQERGHRSEAFAPEDAEQALPNEPSVSKAHSYPPYWPAEPIPGQVPAERAAADGERPEAPETSIDDIRASLRDFGHRVEGLAEARIRRRYF
ncbi:GumC family protein [Mesorhizobium sp. KR1-2]|uniref:GumC family protein n=1 Tax=Mesorhizobium sp. KR1-2 TaxID=3156609 RepID=UPI0032B4A2FA